MKTTEPRGKRSKGVRREIVFAPSLISEVRAVAGHESVSTFVRLAVAERCKRLRSHRARLTGGR